MLHEGPRYHVGLDIGEKAHYLVVAEDDPHRGYRVVMRKSYPDTMQGLTDLEEAILRHADPDTGETPFVMVESERAFVTQALVGRDHQVFFVQPTRTRQFRAVLGAAEEKSDSRDAFALACAHWISRGRLRRVRASTATESRLSILTYRQHQSAVRVKSHAASIRSLLKRYWPAAADLYQASGIATKPWYRDILRAYPDPHDFINASPADLEAVLALTRSKQIPRTVKEVLIPLQHQSGLLLPRDRTEAYAAAVLNSLDSLDHAIQVREDVEESLLDTFRGYRYYHALMSIPGTGEVTGARIAAGIGEDPRAFEDRNSLALYAGFLPQFRGSGGLRVISRRLNKSPMLHMAIRETTLQLTIDRDRKGEHDAPRAYSPAARWMLDRARDSFTANTNRIPDQQIRSARAAKAYNHALRVVGVRVCYGIWYMLNPTSGADWEPWDDATTFRSVYQRMAEEEARNRKRKPSSRVLIPQRALTKAETAEVARERRRLNSIAWRARKKAEAAAEAADTPEAT